MEPKRAVSRPKTKVDMIENNSSFFETANQSVGGYDINLNELIGKGSFGKVYKAYKGEQVYAVKIIKKKRIEDMRICSKELAQEMEQRLLNERNFHQQVSGEPNIVELYDTFEDEQAYYSFMDYCQTDLNQLIRKKKYLPENEALTFFGQLLEGYHSIIEQQAFHRDLKPENLLIKDGKLKISDFGFVKLFSLTNDRNLIESSSKVGTFKYMPPEMLKSIALSDRRKFDSEKGDVWSMGIILYKMLFGKQPFDSSEAKQLIAEISSDFIYFPDRLYDQEDKIRPIKISNEVINLIKQMLQQTAQKRISFHDLYFEGKRIIKERLLEGMQAKIGNQKAKRATVKLEPVNEKQELITVYNNLIALIYTDLSEYATLREIGLRENYTQFSYKLMTIIHEKRKQHLEDGTGNNSSLKNGSNGANNNGTHSNATSTNTNYDEGHYNGTNGTYTNGNYTNGTHENGGQNNAIHSNGIHSNGTNNNGIVQNGTGNHDASKNLGVNAKLMQSITFYDKDFYQPIKTCANFLPTDTLSSLLDQFYHLVKKYKDYKELSKKAQYLIHQLLLLYSLELDLVGPDYVYIWSHRARNAKQKVIVKYENNILSMIENKLNERAGMTFFINSSQETGRKEKQEQRRHFVNKSKEAKPK